MALIEEIIVGLRKTAEVNPPPDEISRQAFELALKLADPQFDNGVVIKDYDQANPEVQRMALVFATEMQRFFVRRISGKIN